MAGVQAIVAALSATSAVTVNVFTVQIASAGIARRTLIVLALKVVAAISANLAPTALDFLVQSTLIVQVGKPVVSENANTRMTIVTIQPW